MQERSLEGQPLTHAARKPRDLIVGPIDQPRAFESRRNCRLRVEAVEFGGKGEVLPGGQLRVEVQLVRQQADASAKRRSAVARRLVAVPHVPRAGRDERREDADECGFARAVRAEQADDVPRCERQGNLGQRPAPAEVSRHVGQVD
jgi:hypothetical protein